jgi:hypothetical protein
MSRAILGNHAAVNELVDALGLGGLMVRSLVIDMRAGEIVCASVEFFPDEEAVRKFAPIVLRHQLRAVPVEVEQAEEGEAIEEGPKEAGWDAPASRPH